MTDEDASQKSKKRSHGKKGNRENSKGRKDKSPEHRSAASSNQSNNLSTPKLPKNSQAQQKPFQILKRNPPMHTAQASATPVSPRPPPLMTVPTKPIHTTPKKWNDAPLHEENMNLSSRQATANKNQRDAYYFSAKPGTAISVNEFQDSYQYKRNDFPLDRNVDILIERKISLMITPTSGRCKALYIRVKSQHNDNTVSVGALLNVDADDKEVKKACDQVIENFYIVLEKSPHARYPFCEISEPFLVTCFIRRLEERQDAFPEAIYYCEKCDYHINTMGHAKAHLESSTHFEDVERQQQRRMMLERVPEPSEEQLEAVDKVLREQLAEYQSLLQIKQDGEDRTKKVITYLTTQLFPSLGYSEIEMKPFGSATYDVILPDSDFNIAFTTNLPVSTPIFAFLEKIRKQISEDGYMADHSMDMGSSSTIIFTFETTRVRLCWLSSFAHRGQLHFSQLMKVYTSLRPEVIEFLQLIRLWAAAAQVDSKNKPRIGLPRYGFDILAIHYLQQSGYLPVLHELYSRESEEKATSEENEEDVKVEQKQKPQADDASNPKNQPEEARQRRIRLASRYMKDREKILEAFPALEQPWNMAKLWIGFFKYFVHHNREVVVQITQLEPMTRDYNKWNKKILHVMDPYRSDNVLSIPKVSTWQPYYFNCLLATYLAFAVPRSQKGPLIEWSLVQNKAAASKKKKETAFGTPKRVTAALETPKSTPQMTQITEEEYNYAADLVAEEEEEQRHVEELMSKLSFDGVKLNELKCEDVEIDDHAARVYSRRTTKRVHRVHSLGNTAIQERLMEFGLLKRKLEKKMFKKNKRQSTVETDEEKNEGVTNEEVPLTPAPKTLQPKAPESLFYAAVIAAHDEAEKKAKAEEVYVAQGGCVSIRKPMNELLGHWESDLLDTAAQQNTPTTMLTPSSDGVAPQSATFVPRNFIPDTKRENRICTEEFFIREKFVPTREDLERRVKTMKSTDYAYQFNAEVFSGGYEMEMKCTHCDGSHCVETCPMMEIPPIEKFPPRAPEELKLIDEIIDKYYSENILDDKRLEMLQSKVKELEAYLKKAYRNDVSLTIFGSVMTGLSVNCSDIDICLRFGEGDEPPKGLTARDVIQKTEEVLRRCHLTKNVQAITTAKVPIVKFQIRLANDEVVDVDVSYYNILALYNTLLLREYTNWTPDHRFAKLALFIKSWAKHCDIGDASRGSLSSYAHIILLVSYLQQCDPPVLPRLQEDFRSGNTEKRIIENWDTAFVEAEERLLKEWPKNKETCAQLLIGYLDYYSRFDFRNFVVQCRREMILCKMEKEWPKPLCVEDPFDLNHNLSSGVTKKMFVFIMKVFIASRAAFMSVKPDGFLDFSYLNAFRNKLFAECSQGTAPTDRQCHMCHRIGHFYESCPQSSYRKDSRKRYGSNSTNSSYRSHNQNGAVEGDRVTYHKRSYNRRFNR